MPRIVFIVQQLSQPRCIKRIQSIYETGLPVKVYGFDSGLYNDSLKSLPFSVHEIIKRDKNDSKVAKVRLFWNTVRRVLRENSTDDLFYVFGYELGLCIRFSGCKHYIYEEADVSAARINNKALRSLMLSLDRSIIGESYRTVFTSQGFVSYIFPQNAPMQKLIFMPNKLSPYFNEQRKKEVSHSTIDISHIRFGFIGLIRYPNTIIRFAKVIGNYYPQHEFHFFGEPEKQSFIDDELKSFKNVHFHGRFKNPTDLNRIYGQIDISVVCYDTSSGNVRIAEPNKIYESIFFETPIVVSNGSYLAHRVESLGIGYHIDASSDSNIRTFVDSIKMEQLHQQIENMKTISWKDVVEDATKLQKEVQGFFSN